MIIQNNFNSKNMDGKKDYSIIGKGSNSTDKQIQKEKDGMIKENLNNPVLQNLINRNNTEEDNDSGNKWDFFR